MRCVVFFGGIIMVVQRTNGFFFFYMYQYSWVILPISKSPKGIFFKKYPFSSLSLVINSCSFTALLYVKGDNYPKIIPNIPISSMDLHIIG